MKLNILVTGCGGDIGQSVGKILTKNENVEYLIGCDISDKNAGKFIFKNFFIGVPCSHPDYIKTIEDVVEKHNIDLIIPIAEPELRFLTKSKILSKIGNAKIVCANQKSLEIGFDKLKTADFLEENGLPFPKTKLISTINNQLDFPAIIKSRTGSGSSTIHIANNDEDFIYLKNKHSDFIIQEFLPSDEGEFTCGVFRSKNGDIRSIILKRELTGGYSGYGEVIHNNVITKLLTTIAERLDLRGSINVQLRLTSKGPVVFEINPRFSSTVLFRHIFGFEDLKWSIQDKIEQKISVYNEVEAGKRFYKGFSEYIN